AQAVPALTGLGLVLLAAGAALGISGPVGRRVVGGFLLLAGVAAGWLVLAVVRSPGAALRRTVAEHTGVGAVPEGVATSPWPFLTLGLAVVVVAVGVAHVLGGGPWPEPGARVRRGAERAAAEPRAPGTNGPTSTGDGLSHRAHAGPSRCGPRARRAPRGRHERPHEHGGRSVRRGRPDLSRSATLTQDLEQGEHCR